MHTKFKFKKTNEEKLDNLLLEHYKRCKDFCLSYNSTIWSMPSVATAINVGTYYALFDTNKKIAPFVIVITLFILSLLNFALMVGVKRHLHFQRQFGKRIMEIEKQNDILPVDLDSGSILSRLKAGWIYKMSMWIITIISTSLFIMKLVEFLSQTPEVETVANIGLLQEWVLNI